jgi:hypothetical protein
LALPTRLRPIRGAPLIKCSEDGRFGGTCEDLRGVLAPVMPLPGTPVTIVQSCRERIVAAARPYGVVRVDAASAGPLRPLRNGFAAPLQIRVLYARRGGLEARLASIRCIIGSGGQVHAML